MTTSELNQGVDSCSSDMLTINVRHHKTGTTGCAHVTVKGTMVNLVTMYAKQLRPAIDVSSNLAFPNPSGAPIDHLSRKVQALAKEFSIQLPTATMSRHTSLRLLLFA